jgi:hypothetical protein
MEFKPAASRVSSAGPADQTPIQNPRGMVIFLAA